MVGLDVHLKCRCRVIEADAGVTQLISNLMALDCVVQQPVALFSRDPFRSAPMCQRLCRNWDVTCISQLLCWLMASERFKALTARTKPRQALVEHQNVASAFEQRN
jgi:hypothetical protein